MAILKLVPLWVWALLVGVGALWITTARLHSAQEERDAAQASLIQASTREASLRSTLDLQRTLYNDSQKVNDEYSNRVQAAEAESSRLADDLRTGARGLSVSATCVPRANPVSSPIGSTDGDTPRLTDSAQRDYLRLVAGIQKQRAQVIGLQSQLMACVNMRSEIVKKESK